MHTERREAPGPQDYAPNQAVRSEFKTAQSAVIGGRRKEKKQGSKCKQLSPCYISHAVMAESKTPGPYNIHKALTATQKQPSSAVIGERMSSF